ncbi:MAG: type II secretion system F family protein [Nitrospinae bacterium]|nr:type II secretion system F family protein [Nitrospinota bacterium]
MPDYQYKAIDNAGNSVTGVMTAGDMRSLEGKLTEIDCFLVDATESALGAAGSKKGRRKKIKRRDIIDFCIQMESLLSAGVTLLETVKTLAKESPNARLGEILADVARNVEAGYSFHEAMANHPTLFSPQAMSMIRAGEQSGSMPQTFREITKYLEWIDRLMGDIKQATIYPVAVLSFLVIFITILFTFVVPRFIVVLLALNIPLPLPTRLIMLISGFFVATWWMWIIAAIAFPFIVRMLKKKWPAFLFQWDNMKLNLPVFGDLNRMFAISRFSQNFSTLFKAGLPILQNLSLCEEVVGNKVFEKLIVQAKSDVEEGIMLSESFAKGNVFPPIVLRMVSVGEATGDIGTALDNISRYFNEEIPRRVKRIFGIMEPAIMLFLIGIVGFTALAIFMPILSLMGGIKR